MRSEQRGDRGRQKHPEHLFRRVQGWSPIPPQVQGRKDLEERRQEVRQHDIAPQAHDDRRQQSRCLHERLNSQLNG